MTSAAGRIGFGEPLPKKLIRGEHDPAEHASREHHRGYPRADYVTDAEKARGGVDPDRRVMELLERPDHFLFPQAKALHQELVRPADKQSRADELRL
jgi:hypothetical protein